MGSGQEGYHGGRRKRTSRKQGPLTRTRQRNQPPKHPTAYPQLHQTVCPRRHPYLQLRAVTTISSPNTSMDTLNLAKGTATTSTRILKARHPYRVLLRTFHHHRWAQQALRLRFLLHKTTKLAVGFPQIKHGSHHQETISSDPEAKRSPPSVSTRHLPPSNPSL